MQRKELRVAWLFSTIILMLMLRIVQFSTVNAYKSQELLEL